MDQATLNFMRATLTAAEMPSQADQQEPEAPLSVAEANTVMEMPPQTDADWGQCGVLKTYLTWLVVPRQSLTYQSGHLAENAWTSWSNVIAI